MATPLSVPPRRKPGNVNSLYVQVLIDHLIDQGIAPERLFDSGLLARVRVPDQTIPVTQWHGMFEQAIAATGDQALPLRVAERVEVRHLGLLGFAVMSSPRLREVLAILGRYERLVDDVNVTHVIHGATHVELHWIPLHGPVSPIFMQLSLATWMVMIRKLTGKAMLVGEPHFAFPAPAEIDAYSRLFKSAPKFDQPMTKLVFDNALLDVPIMLHNPEAYQLLLGRVEKALQEQCQPELLLLIQEQIVQRLPAGNASLREIAAALSMSPRTLQNRLTAMGLGFREVLDRVREERAKQYLADGSIGLGEIAFLLGYSEQSAFQHAFNRWTGKTPGSYRNLLGSAPSAPSPI